MTQEERSKVLELIGLGGAGLLVLLVVLGGGLWGFAPDLEDGRPPRNTRAYPGEPVGMNMGPGLTSVPPPPPDAVPPARLEAGKLEGEAVERPLPQPRVGVARTPPLPEPPPGHRRELPNPPPNPSSEPPSAPAREKPEAPSAQPPSS